MLSNFQEKYPKLISKFEKTTGKKAAFRNGELTKNFIYWIKLQIKNKNGFNCDDSNCPKFGQRFESKRALTQHITWHDRQYKRISIDKSISEFFSNYLKEHSYLPKNIAKHYIEIKPASDYNLVKSSFRSIMCNSFKCGFLIKHSNSNYKINKEMVNELIGRS